MELLKNFYEEEEGLGTVEMVVLLAVLVSIALIFRKTVTTFVTGSLQKIFNGAENGMEENNNFTGGNSGK